MGQTAWEQPVPITNVAQDRLYRNDGGYSHAYALLKRATRPANCIPVSMRFETSNNDAREVIRWLIPSSSRIHFEQWCLGYSYVIQCGSPLRSKIRREIPDQHPEKPNLFAERISFVEAPGWKASEVTFALAGNGADTLLAPPSCFITGYTLGVLDARGNILGQGDPNADLLQCPAAIDNKGIAHDDALLTVDVEYRPRKYQIHTDTEIDTLFAGNFPVGEVARWVEYERVWAIQAIPIAVLNKAGQGQLITFVQGVGQPAGPPTPQSLIGKNVDNGLVFLASSQVIFRWKDVPDVPESQLVAGLGTCNSVDFGGFSGVPIFPAQTLLMQAPGRIVRTEGTNLRHIHDIEWRFDERPQGWNKGLATDGNYYPMASNGLLGNAIPPFKTSDFYQLFAARTPPVNYTL
jgi:hypothetical protein